jgi:hypothetical protein
MKLRHLLVAAALALTTTTAWAQGFSDTSMSVRDGPWISNPGGINTAFGPISAVNFEIGGDAESENTEFAPAKKLLVVGPNFHVAVPAGFLNIGLHFSQEWNNNGISNCPNACFVHGGRVSSMPLGNVTEITEAERSTLGSWIEAGSTLD